MTHLRISLVLIAFVAVAGAACSRSGDPAAPESIDIRPALTTETPVVQTTAIIDRIDWPNLDRLVAAVDVVAIVRWQGDTYEPIGFSAADGTEKAPRVDLLQSFEVIRVLKGADVPAAIVARMSSLPTTPLVGNGTAIATVPALEAGTEYLVFLRQLRPEQGGGFGSWGEPGLARIEDDELQWLVSDAYRDAKSRAGWSIGRDGAVTMFDNLDVADVEGAIKSQR